MYASVSSYMSYTSVQDRCRSIDAKIRSGSDYHSLDPLSVKTDECSQENCSQSRDFYVSEKFKGKRPKEEWVEDLSNLKRPKQEYDEDLGSPFCSSWLASRGMNSTFRNRHIPAFQRQVPRKAGLLDGCGISKLSMPNSCRSLDQVVAKPPYFFYGNVMNLSHDCWVKISQFLYAEPEFVNTQFFSALSRKEGYVHNLPIENRFQISPRSPMTIEEALPHTRKWWPSWDTRKNFSCINSETSGISELCDRLGKMLIESKGNLPVKKQHDLLHYCGVLNLVWIGHYKLAPVEPEHLEYILGYPMHHTDAAGFRLMERLHSLNHCFQIDTLAYHLSVLKSLFPGGLTVLSIFSGVGGAEVALHRLAVHLKGVVSVEPSETKRMILKNWWKDSGQNGELLQIANIKKLTSTILESLIKKFGGFDLVICQNPCPELSRYPNAAASSGSTVGLDFTLFHEFVRVLQCVRSMMERNG